MAKKERINTDSLFQSMIPQHNKEEKTNVKNNEIIKVEQIKEQVVPVNKGRKPLKEKNVQVSIYLKPEQAKELRLQDATKEKESDKSAIARTGIDIVLKMSNEIYRELKTQSELKNITPGELVESILKEHFKK